MALEDSLSVFGCFSLVFDYLLIMNVIWNINIFSADHRILLVSVHGSDVSG